MAATTVTYQALQAQLKSGKAGPLYLLHGEEGYYIDRLVEGFEALVPESERDFNLYTLYGPETTMATVHEVCRRYPMMSDRQVVIVKELQNVNTKELDKLAVYLSSPSPTTTLVLCFRGESAKGKEMLKAFHAAGGVTFESKKLRDNTVASSIKALVEERGLHIEAKGLAMLKDHIGTDLSRLYNEIDKLGVALPKGAMVTPEVIERHVGVSKDYNSFELVDALATRNAVKAYTIVNHFRANPKANPFPMVLATIFGFFSDLMVYQFARDKSATAAMKEMGARSTYAVERAARAARQYNAYQTIEIISALRSIDVQSKGVGSRRDPYDLLQELVYHILNAPGTLPV